MANTSHIFLVGTGRSGSTIVFEILSSHEDLGWFSNYDKLLPWTDFAAIAARIYDCAPFNNLMRGERKQYSQGRSMLNRIKPQPFECYNKWRRLCGDKFAKDFLVEIRATPREKRKVMKSVNMHLRLQRKDRFLAKFTGPTRMIYLKSIFPDAKFIHIKRNPIAVVGSLLSVGFWTREKGRQVPRWSGFLPKNWEQEWERYGKTSIALTAMQYREIVRRCERERQGLAEDQYMEVGYEEFVEDPKEQIDTILEFSELRPSPNIDAYLAAHEYENKNQKYFDRLAPDEKKTIRTILATG